MAETPYKSHEQERISPEDLRRDIEADDVLIITEEESRSAKEHLSDAGKALWDLLKQYSTGSDILGPLPEAEKAQPGKHSSKHTIAFKLLLSFPYFLVAVFIVGQFWDFDGIKTIVWGYELNFEGLLTILSVSGMIGFLTNWLAITMLFQPKYKRPLLGQGLIPSQKSRIAFRMAQAVSRDLINPEIIQAKLQESQLLRRYREKLIDQIKFIIDNPEFRTELKQVILSYSEEIMGDPELRATIAKEILVRLESGVKDKQFERMVLKTYKYVRGDEMQEIIEHALESVPESLEDGLNRLDNLFDELPEKIDAYSPQIEAWVSQAIFSVLQRFDVHHLVEENINRFEEDRLEQLIKGTTNEQFRYIQYIGAVLGTIGGFVIWQPLLAVSVIATIVFGLFAADELLHRSGKTKKT
jgi:uncharacterized membrane protein YheB (UPF0754 family)